MKIIYAICILVILLVNGCAAQPEEPDRTNFIINAEAKGVYTTEERFCNELAEKIIKNCKDLNPDCFLYKEEWDSICK